MKDGTGIFNEKPYNVSVGIRKNLKKFYKKLREVVKKLEQFRKSLLKRPVRPQSFIEFLRTEIVDLHINQSILKLITKFRV